MNSRMDWSSRSDTPCRYIDMGMTPDLGGCIRLKASRKNSEQALLPEKKKFLNVVVCPEINFNNRKDANNIFMQKVAHKMMIKIDPDHRPNSMTFPAQNVILS